MHFFIPEHAIDGMLGIIDKRPVDKERPYARGAWIRAHLPNSISILVVGELQQRFSCTRTLITFLS
jgi:hypothetical protein